MLVDETYSHFMIVVRLPYFSYMLDIQHIVYQRELSEFIYFPYLYTVDLIFILPKLHDMTLDCYCL